MQSRSIHNLSYSYNITSIQYDILCFSDEQTNERNRHVLKAYSNNILWLFCKSCKILTATTAFKFCANKIQNKKLDLQKKIRGTICNRMIQTIICKVCKNNPEQNFARYGVEQEFATFWNKIIQNNNCHEKVIHNDNIHVLHENYVEPQFAKLSTTKMIRSDNL